MANETSVAVHLLCKPKARTLCRSDWNFWNDDGRYMPPKFEAFLDAAGYGNGRSGVRPEMPDWAIDETEAEHKKWRGSGLKPCITYFARARYTGRIKIGKTSQVPEARVQQLAHANLGEESELLCTRRGEYFESLYHRAFYTWALGHEWFAPHPDILAEIAFIQSIAA